MALIIWNNSQYGVQNDTIDEQHKQLVEMINELSDALTSKKGFEITDGVLQKTLDYTYYHFSTEEALMEKYAYPEIKSHKTQHETFKTKITLLQREHRDHVATVPRELLVFLREWLINHITHVDKKLGLFLVQQGLK